MHILLSSAYRPRYREDILRCVSSPPDAVLQFRYEQSRVSPKILAGLDQVAGDAIVCFIDTNKNRIVPVRAVAIKRVMLVGSSVVVSLQLKEFVHAPSEEFTKEVERLSGEQLRANGQGSFFFDLSGEPTTCVQKLDLEIWEEVVGQLSEYTAFQREGEFFWVVLGLSKSCELSEFNNEFQSWTGKIKADTSYQLCIYHWHPKSPEREETKGHLVIQHGIGLFPTQPEQIPIDSRYDLKTWRFIARGSPACETVDWLNIGPEDGWTLDLPVTISHSAVRVVVRVLAIALFVAAPPAIAVMQQPPLTLGQKIGVVVASLVFGLVASLTAVLGFRPRT